MESRPVIIENHVDCDDVSILKARLNELASKYEQLQREHSLLKQDYDNINAAFKRLTEKVEAVRCEVREIDVRTAAQDDSQSDESSEGSSSESDPDLSNEGSSDDESSDDESAAGPSGCTII